MDPMPMIYCTQDKMTSQLPRARLATGTLLRAASRTLAILLPGLLLLVSGATAEPGPLRTLSGIGMEQMATPSHHVASSATVPTTPRCHGNHCTPESPPACGLLHCTTLAATTLASALVDIPVLREAVTAPPAGAIRRPLPPPDFPPPRA